MARPQRNDVDYFPHTVTHGRKMFIIEKKYGNDGYAVWFKLLEVLGAANYHYIDIMQESDVMFLASKCGVSEEKLESIINDLVKLGEFDKELHENGILYNHHFIESIQDAYKKRGNDCIDRNALLDLLESLGRLKPDKGKSKGLNSGCNPQRKEKDRIGKDSKEKNICPHQKIIEAYHNILPQLPSVQVWNDSSKKALSARWNEDKERQSVEWWKLFFKDNILASDFLMGKKTDWRANLSWIVGPKNFGKIMNGQYLNNKKPNSNKQACADFLKDGE